MSALIFGFCAASGGATLGLFLGAIFACGKLRDMELAYGRLADDVRHFVQSHAGRALHEPVVSVPSQHVLNLEKAFLEAESISGRGCPNA
jgi:hypothetical protein